MVITNTFFQILNLIIQNDCNIFLKNVLSNIFYLAPCANAPCWTNVSHNIIQVFNGPCQRTKLEVWKNLRQARILLPYVKCLLNPMTVKQPAFVTGAKKSEVENVFAYYLISAIFEPPFPITHPMISFGTVISWVWWVLAPRPPLPARAARAGWMFYSHLNWDLWE